jgi:type II secretory pathway pseudopilin PulG
MGPGFQVRPSCCHFKCCQGNLLLQHRAASPLNCETRRRRRCDAFTKTEFTVAILVVAVILVLAWPTIMSALQKREMTRTMNNVRELYLAGFHMATDGAAKSDANLAWPGDYPATSFSEYCGKLVQNDYLKAGDLQRILSAPGASCTVTSTASSPATVTLSGKSALKVYKAKNSDPSTTIFAASSNYVYDTALSPNAKPFGDAGFVVVHKSGDAGLFGKNQATPAGFENDPVKFQSPIGIGRLPGAADGVVSPGDGAMVLESP